MATIGLALREARERTGISVADAASKLHIRKMFVEAIEREEWRTIGEPVYVRGFVRNYARLVGVDPQSVVDSLNAEIDAGAREDIPATALRLPEPSRRFKYPALLGAMSLVAVLLVIRVIWTVVTPSAVGHDEVRPPLAAADTNAQTTASLPLGAAAAATDKSAQSGVDLRLRITQPCWLSVVVDGKQVMYQTLPAGTVKEFRGAREISLRAGNAGGVVATVDGQPLGTLGSNGQVRDRVFAVRTSPIGPSTPHE